MRIIRIIGIILSWVAGLLFLGVGIAFAIAAFKHNGSKLDITNKIVEFAGGILGFIHGYREFIVTHKTILGPIVAAISLVVAIIIFVICISNGRFKNVLQIGIGIACLIFISWIAGIILILGGLLKLITPKHFEKKYHAPERRPEPSYSNEPRF